MSHELALNIFEELRFIIELIIAEQIFTYHFAKQKINYRKVTGIGYTLLILTAISYVPLIQWMQNVTLEYIPEYSGLVTRVFAPGWYIVLLILSLVVLKLSYEITYSDVLFMGIAGYSAQHIEYTAVNEVIAMGFWPSVTKNLPLYIFLCITTCLVLYFILAKVFAQKLRECEGMIYDNSLPIITYFLTILMIMFMSAFMCQSIFRNESGGEINYLGAGADFFNCTLVLVVQYSIFRISTLNREKEIVKQLLYERQKQYQLSKENIEIINHKCHDLKHQIAALRTAKEEELSQYIDEVEESVMFYDSVVETDNEVLNTILSEKSLYCEKHQIKLSCIIDSDHLYFMSTMDIYALLGNALDNAIECVSKYVDPEKRVISLTIYAKESFLCIQTNNYFDGELSFKDGLPLSTKNRRRAYHGFGMKSMKHLTEKYGGTLYANLENGIFMLQIILPMPKEFIRLLKESKS